ncbi:Tn7-like element transposition protein TnsE [Massilibacterium senegalense]|uniref:Tn7-like element transposition protein TnsE n=1 Tax=Massilibacterium senegalense TaxID=1632858 RepID=UPI00164CF8BE
MIRYLAEFYKHLSVSVNFVYLPLGRKFSYLPDGRRRVCAIVRASTNLKTSYKLEIAVPDNRSLLTLLMLSKGNYVNNEHIINNLPNNLANSSGSWSHSFLQNQESIKIKHFKETQDQWAFRLFRFL